MPKFSERSLKNLKTLHPKLQKVLNEAIKTTDFVITDARRGKAAQESAFAQGRSKVHFKSSAHNYSPAVAADVYPYPIPTNMDTKAYRGKLKAMQIEIAKAAERLDIEIRQGIDFNRDGNFNNDKFVDLPHVELFPWRDFVTALYED